MSSPSGYNNATVTAGPQYDRGVASPPPLTTWHRPDTRHRADLEGAGDFAGRRLKAHDAMGRDVNGRCGPTPRPPR